MLIRQVIRQANSGKMKSKTAFASLLRRYLVYNTIFLFFFAISPAVTQARISKQTLIDAEEMKKLKLE